MSNRWEPEDDLCPDCLNEMPDCACGDDWDDDFDDWDEFDEDYDVPLYDNGEGDDEDEDDSPVVEGYDPTTRKATVRDPNEDN